MGRFLRPGPCAAPNGMKRACPGRSLGLRNALGGIWIPWVYDPDTGGRYRPHMAPTRSVPTATDGY
jgi:hypothetical protein